jgi:hypothetical protein
MSDAGPLEPPPGTQGPRRRKAGGTWVGYAVFVLVLLFFITLAGEYAYQHEWPDFAGTTVFTLIFLTVPTGGARWAWRRLRDRKPPQPPSERAA